MRPFPARAKLLILVLAAAVAFDIPIRAQTPPRAPAAPLPATPAPSATAGDIKDPKEPDYTVELSKFGWTEENNLVLGLNIMAVGKVMELGGIKGKGKGEKLDAFSLGSGTLVDAYTNKKIRPMERLPRKPFFGTMACINTLNKGDSMVMGVAFPKPPIPPLGPDGKQQPYKFVYHHPSIKPVEITFPCENNTATPSVEP